MNSSNFASHSLRVTGLFGILFAAGTSEAADWYVFADGTGDTPTIQEAIDQAAMGDQVFVGPGTYTDMREDSDGFLSIVELRSGVDVISLDGPEATILDAHMESGERRCVSAYYVEFATLEGFTLTKGDLYTGSGLFLESSNVTVQGNHVIDNYAGEGGGIAISGPGSPIIQNNLIDDNIACCAPGGGIFIRSGASPRIENNRISRNSGFTGGGIGMVDAGEAVVRRNLIVRNIGLSGGGVGMINSPATIEANWILDNQASQGGGCAAENGLSPTFRNNVVARNLSDGDGGGYYIRASSPLLEQETIVRNEAWVGAGVFNWYGGSPRLQNCIVAFGINGDGVYGDDPSSIPILDCTNVFGNEFGEYGGFMEDVTGVDGNVSLDPMFCDLSRGSYYLAPDSPHRKDAECGMRGALSQACPAISAVDGDPGVPLWAPEGKAIERANDGETTAVDDSAEEGPSAESPVPSGLQVWPNPATDRITVSFARGEDAGSGALSVIDVHGRRVWGRSIPANGNAQMEWDTLDQSGRPVGSGLYWILYQDDQGGREVRSVTLRR